MKSAAFDYVSALTVADAGSLLAAGGGNAKLLAGGQSLVPTMNLRLARPAQLIDLKRAQGLRSLEEQGDRLVIGAGWTHAEIEDGVVPDPAAGMLRHVASDIAFRAVRNRGTLGGSLAHADPAADWMSTLICLDAVIVVQKADGSRVSWQAEEFMRGAYTTRLAETDVLAAVAFGRLSTEARWGYHKVCAKVGAFALAIGAAVHDPARGFARVVCGAVDGPPVLLPRSAEALRTGVEAAASLVAEEIRAVLPRRTPAQQRVHTACVERALRMLAP